MGLIPFIGDDSENDEDGLKGKFGSFADNTELSRGEQKESNEEIAEMHKSRSRKAFQENDQFSGSSGEWKKVTDSQNSFSDTDRGQNNFEDQNKTQIDETQQNEEQFEQDLGNQNREKQTRHENTDMEGSDSPAQGFKQMEKTLDETVEQASKMRQEFEESEDMPEESVEEKESNELEQQEFNENREEPVEQGVEDVETPENTDDEALGAQEKEWGPQEKNENIDKQEVTDNLEKNISQIKSQIESGNVSREGLEDVASRFEELVDRLEEMDSEEPDDEDDKEDEFKEDVREDLSSFQDEIIEMKDKQETLDKRYRDIENAVTKASEEDEDIRVEDIKTIERLDELEDEVEELKSGEAGQAADQVHMEALENEVKELRKDVRELSEAVVTISQKVFK